MPSARLGWVVAVIVSLLLFGMLAWNLRTRAAFVFDEPVLHFFHSIASPGWDRFFLFFSAIGYRYGVVPIDVVLTVVMLWRHQWRLGIFIALASAGTGLLNSGAKHIFGRARPSLWESIAPEHNFSFPSGHAMGSMSLALVVLLLVWNTRWRAVALIAMAVFIAGVGMSRVYLGVHYPSDIVAGWSFSVAWIGALYLLVWKTPVAARSVSMDSMPIMK